MSLGRLDLLPAALLAVNVAAVAGGTLALAALLARRGCSPWWAAAYGLAPGLWIAVSRDLTEPLAYGLAAAALLVLDRAPGLSGALAGGVLLALGGLARESVLVFAAAAALALAVGRPRRVRDAALLAAVAVVPYVVVKAGLALWLEGRGAPFRELELVPFRGLAELRPFDRPALEQVYAVVAPALVAAGATALAAARLGAARTAPIALWLNVVAFVVLLPALSYAELAASGRITLGVVVALVASVPLLAASGVRGAAWVAVVLWMAPWYDLLPRAFAP